MRSLLLTSLGHFVNDGSGICLPLLVDILAKFRGLRPIEVTALLFGYSACSAVTSIYVGITADKRGAAGPLVGLGIGIISSGLAGFALVVAYASGSALFVGAGVCALIMGAGSAFYHPLGGSILQTAFSGGGRGRALGLNGSMGNLGSAVYPSLFVAAALLLTQQGAAALLGAVGLGAAVIIWIGLRRIRSEASSRLDPGARETLTRPMVALISVSFLRSVALQGIATWIPLFLTFQKGLDLTQVGLEISAMYALAVLGQPFAGLLLDRFDGRLVLAFTTAGAMVSIFGYLFSTGLVDIVLLSLYGFFSFNAFPLLMSLASHYTRSGKSSLGNALVWGVGTTGGGAVGPLLIGALILDQYARLTFAFEIMIVIGVFTTAFAFVLPRPAPRTPSAAKTGA